MPNTNIERYTPLLTDHLKASDVATAVRIGVEVLRQRNIPDADIAASLRFAFNAIVDEVVPPAKSATKPARKSA